MRDQRGKPANLKAWRPFDHEAFRGTLRNQGVRRGADYVQLAVEAGTSVATLKGIAFGRTQHPRTDILWRVAAALDVDPIREGWLPRMT